MTSYSTEFVWHKESFDQLVKACEENVITPYVLKYTPSNGKILEAGCGIGHIVKFFQDRGYDIVGVEMGEDTVKNAHEIIPECNIVCANVEDLPYKDNTFDTILSLGVVEHIIDGPEKALKEMYRVLKPGGVMVFTIPVCNTIRSIKRFSGLYFLERLVRKFYYKMKGTDTQWVYGRPYIEVKRKEFLVWPFGGPFFEYRFTKKQTVKMLGDAGFSIIEENSSDGLGGLYHEFGGALIDPARPNLFWRVIDRIFSYLPSFHNHAYIAIVKK
jgi:SAM-dependent methyltransferase